MTTETAPTPPRVRPAHSDPVAVAAVAAAIDARVVGEIEGVEVTGVTLSSRAVAPGDLYVGIKGVNAHGASYTAEARERGAVAVLTDEAGLELARDSGLPVLVVDVPRGALGAASAVVYRYEPGAVQLLGVTGTNGKTSTVHVLDGMFAALGETAGLSSTAERRIAGDAVVAGLTTPEVNDMHALIATMQERGVTGAAIEVSAQAVTRHRVDGLRFTVMGFTNLSHDHLDDYATMDDYFDAKVALFTPERAERAVVSLDSPWGQKVVERSGIPVVTVSSSPEVDADWKVRTLSIDTDGTVFEVTGPNGESLVSSMAVIGPHMASNAGLAIAMLVEAGRPFETIAAALTGARLPAIPGRTENVAAPGSPAVFVDFGHTPDAFAKTLDAVRAVTTGKVIMLFGADGDRDATKRYDMASEAVLRSDILVITDHHPRFENPASIRRTLLESAISARPDAEIHVVSPPPRAIRIAVSLAGAGDSILWAGPGHQNYRDIEGVRTAYSAREEARQALREYGWEAIPAPVTTGN